MTRGIFASTMVLCTFLAPMGTQAQGKVTISPATLPAGQYGAGYKAQTIKATGGKAPYTYSVSTGKLPPGISLTKVGVLSGTPTAAGGYAFAITAQDNGKGKNAITGTKSYNLTISQASLTIIAGNATMTAGSAIPTLTVSYSGFVNGDNASSLSTQPRVTTTATSASPAGSYPITASGATDPNYNIGYRQGTLTVNAAPDPPGNPDPPPGNPGGDPGGGGAKPVKLVVTAQPQTKEYGAADPPLTYTVAGLPSGTGNSIFTGSLTRAAGEHVGSYAITKGTLSAGAGYNIAFSGNFLTITKAAQQISWMQSLLIGCNTATQIQLNATASSGEAVTYQVSDPSVVTVSGDVLTLLHPGTAVVTATQGGDANHAPAAAVKDTVVYQPASLINQHWNDVLLFDNSGGNFVAWQWYKNGDSIPGAVLPYYSENPPLDGQYFVIATSKAGETMQSCTLTVNGDSAKPAGIKVYPNPAKPGMQITVTASFSAPALQGAIIQVVDVNGRVRQQITAVQPSTTVTMPSQTGIYIINLLLPGGQKVSTNALVD
jgi:hypothetical protein